MKQGNVVHILLLSATVAWAQQKPAKPEIHFDDPRVVLIHRSAIIPVYLCDLQGTEVTLPQGELLRISSVGDSENWVVTAVAEDRRDISIRPREPLTQQTILNVTSDHDNRYVFRLALNEGHCDSHVTLEADFDIEKNIQTVQPWVSPDQYKAALQAAEEAKQQAAAAEQKAALAAQKAEQSQDQFRSHYPQKLVFDYVYDKKKAPVFGVNAIFHDDRFTYIKAQSQEPPVLFEWKDGEPSLIEFAYADGLYRTGRIIDGGYLVRGGNGNGKHQEKLALKRDPKLGAGPSIAEASAHGKGQ